MSSALKNFLITFVLALTAFIVLGFYIIAPWLEEVFIIDTEKMGELASDNSDESNSSGDNSDVSGNTSDNTSGSDTQAPDYTEYDENGDVFTAVVMCVDDYGRALNTVFIDSNARTHKFIYCTLPSSAKAPNEIGVMVPINTLFGTLTNEGVANSVTAMTGIETDYCLRFDRESLAAVVDAIPGAYVVLNEKITFDNPKYDDIVFEPGQTLPEDYTITIENNMDGKVILEEDHYGKTKLQWLLEYNPNSDGSVYNTLYLQICKTLIRQFFESESLTKNSAALTKILEAADTNMSLDNAMSHLDTIFSYDDFQREEITYPSKWENAVEKLRELDGEYKQFEED